MFPSVVNNLITKSSPFVAKKYPQNEPLIFRFAGNFFGGNIKFFLQESLCETACSFKSSPDTYADYHRNDEQHGVEEVGDDFNGRNACQSCRHEQLSTIRNKTLHDARAGVENAGATSGIYAIALGNVF